MMASVATINNLGGHAHNPRGNLWFNDESTYGHKLLMKMGWNKGKGLGKNEDGIKENLKVKFRNTNSGLGFKDDAYANVMKSEYESILKNLATQYSCPETTNLNKAFDSSNDEPVQKSKVVKSKLRYPKLFFGKDVTKYSEKDMKSIFICSNTPLKSIEGESKDSVTFDKKDSQKESPQEVGTYSSSLSISDYFAKKMEAKKSNMINKVSNGTAVHEETSPECKNTDPTTLTLNNSVTSKRKQKNLQVDIERGFNNVKQNEASTEIEDPGALNFALPNKKSSKKRKKKREINVINQDTELNSEEILSFDSNFSKEEILENSSEETISSNSNKCAIENNINENSRINKKRKLSQAFENNTVESVQSTFPSEIKLSLSPTQKKRKKCETYSAKIKLPSENLVCKNNLSAEIPIETNNCSFESSLSSNRKCSKKKKKSRKKLKEKLKSCLKTRHGSYSLKNISFNETVSYRIIDSETESVEPLAYSENLGANTFYSLTDSDKNNSNDDAYLEEKTASNDINSEDICAEEQDDVSEESDEQWKLSDLPSSKSLHYNAWVESQRQALKMKLYKSMFKSIKKHKILKTTNLLSIKGYGNWGFK